MVIFGKGVGGGKDAAIKRPWIDSQRPLTNTPLPNLEHSSGILKNKAAKILHLNDTISNAESIITDIVSLIHASP